MSTDDREHREHTPRWTAATATAIYDNDLSDAAFRVLMALSLHSNQDGECWPRQEPIAMRLGRKRPTVTWHLMQLVQLGYVRCERRKMNDNPHDTRSSNHYWIDGNKGITATNVGLTDIGSENGQSNVDVSNVDTSNVGQTNIKNIYSRERTDPSIVSASASALSGLEENRGATNQKKKGDAEQTEAEAALQWQERQRQRDADDLAAYKALHAALAERDAAKKRRPKTRTEANEQTAG